MRSKRRRNWLIGRIAIGFAVAAFAAPVAQARIDEGIQGQPNAAGEVSIVRPDDRSQPRPVVAGKLLIADPPWQRTPVVQSGSQPRSVATPQAVSTGFDWGDAGIGAGLALGLILLAYGAAVATRRMGRQQTA